LQTLIRKKIKTIFQHTDSNPTPIPQVSANLHSLSKLTTEAD